MQRARVRLIFFVLALRVAMPGDAAMAGSPPLPKPRPADLAPAAPPVPEAAARTCLAKLEAAGARAEIATVPAPSGRGCGIETPVRLSSVTLVSGDVVNLPGEPVLECAFALVLADYIRLIVAPLGEAMLRAKVVSVETGPGLRLPQPGPHCGRQDQRACQRLGCGHHCGRLRRQTACRGGASDRRRRRILFPRDAIGGLRLVHDRPRAGRRCVSRRQSASRRREPRFERQLSHLPVDLDPEIPQSVIHPSGNGRPYRPSLLTARSATRRPAPASAAAPILASSK